MISTRSQEPGGSDGGPQTLVAKESPVVRSRKRKERLEADVHSMGGHTKRGRTAAGTEKDTGTIDSISSDVNGQTRIDNIGERPGDGGDDGITKRAVKVAGVEAEGPKQSVKSKDSQTVLTSNSETRNHSEIEVVTLEATKAIHRRFGSEEMELQPPQLDANMAPEIQIQQASEEKVPSSSDEASEDEAPETVTAAAGFERAHAASASAAKIIERKEAATKQKRKMRDARLNLQAKSSRKRGIIEADQTKTSPKSKNVAVENVPIHDEVNLKAPLSPDTSLPTFLPESILLAEPPSPLPKPPSTLSNSNKTLTTKSRLLDLATKTPKDVKHGSRTIRVLEVGGSRLPPRVSQKSKALREAWLAGRQRGSLGEGGFVPRRKVGGGFVRK